jgi:hypothetical protein
MLWMIYKRLLAAVEARMIPIMASRKFGRICPVVC